MKPRVRSSGVTLLELLVVLMILSLILTAAVKTWDVTLERGRSEATARKLNQLVTAIVGDRDYIVAGRRVDFGFVGDIGRLPDNLRELVMSPPVTPSESSRWRGPYLRATFNESPDGFRIDGWGDTIIYDRDSLFLRSKGGRGDADKTRWQTAYLPFTAAELTNDTVEGQIVDVRGALPDSAHLANIMVTLFYPFEGKLHGQPKNGASQLPGGSFKFYPVPQGTYPLQVQYLSFVPQRESAETKLDVTVYPRIGARGIVARLNVDWNNP